MNHLELQGHVIFSALSASHYLVDKFAEVLNYML